MDKFPGQEHMYRSFDSLEEDSHLYPLEYIHTLIPSGVPPHELKLKKGCPIMLMRNFDPYKGHCNGTKYIVVNLHSRIIEAKIASGPYKDNVLFIPRIVIKPSESTFPFQLKRKQFPVRPCFAITANKSQGQTLGKVGICLERPFFSHGAYYVAQSRVGKKSSLKIMADTQFTENVVYPEIFARGYLIFLTDGVVANLIAWSSGKVKRVVHSVFGAETLSCTEGTAAAILIRQLLSEILFKEPNSETIPIVALTDSKQLYDSVHSSSPCSDKRLVLDIALLQENLKTGEISELRWVPTSKMLADCLTKKGVSCADLTEILETGFFSLEEFIRR
ncbi:hypothetical protein ACHWQZ_G011069 [Mnemiopsis leidyi]